MAFWKAAQIRSDATKRAIGCYGRREPDHANAYRHAVGSADVAVDRTASGRGQEPSQVWWRQLAMRQLGKGVQSEERQMLLPFLFPRHLSLRPAAARWQTDSILRVGLNYQFH
jgi:hypothetical protein